MHTPSSPLGPRSVGEVRWVEHRECKETDMKATREFRVQCKRISYVRTYVLHTYVSNIYSVKHVAQGSTSVKLQEWHVRMQIHTCMYVPTCVCTCVCTYVRMYVRVQMHTMRTVHTVRVTLYKQLLLLSPHHNSPSPYACPRVGAFLPGMH